jgi:putative SOS response-associated peptidase YedK
MCGRAYETYTAEELEMRYLNQRIRRNPLVITPNYNLAPTQISPIVLIKEGERTIEMMRFGLVPFWATDVKSASKYSLINAKGEEIETKRSYKQAFEKRRCIVPLSGFYEWWKNGEAKRPIAIHLRDEPIMSVAGIWELWERGEEKVESFSIVTTAATGFMEWVHDRMPVILSREDEERWLDPSTSVADAKELLVPCPSEWLEAHEVSTLVNSPRNNRPECVEPLAG